MNISRYNEFLVISKVEKIEEVNEGFKEVVLGIGLLANVVLGNVSTASAKDKLNNQDVRDKISHVLSNKEQLNGVIDSLKKNGMEDAAEVIQHNADEVSKELEKIDKSEVNYSTVNDINTLKLRLKSGWALSSVTMDTLKQTIKAKPEIVSKVVWDTVTISMPPLEMFEEGSFTLGTEIKDTISGILAQVTNQGLVVAGIEIESSTDKQRVSVQKAKELEANGFEGNNKGLSEARNAALKNFFISKNGGDTMKIKQKILYEQGEGTVGAADPQDPSARYVKINIILFHVEKSPAPSKDKDQVIITKIIQGFKLVKPLPKLDPQKNPKIKVKTQKYSSKSIDGCPASHF
jgi:hypothetical protein